MGSDLRVQISDFRSQSTKHQVPLSFRFKYKVGNPRHGSVGMVQVLPTDDCSLNLTLSAENDPNSARTVVTFERLVS